MATQTYIITFPQNTVNTSLQIGDVVYAVQQENVLGQSFNTNQPQKVGVVNNILGSIVEVWNLGDGALPGPEDFLVFLKNTTINKSGLKGYYADVQFVNNSINAAELFAVSSEVSESSK